MTKNLGIVVPYRDRAQHLQVFLPHIAAFFSRAATDVGGDIFIQIVEQQPGLDFCAALMRNIGYQLCKDKCDYICFHDVDYLPIWADYSEPDGYSPIAWYGAERVTDSRGVTIGHDMERFFGGVVLFTKVGFEQVNGYSNSYWGWGYQDVDIAHRCMAEGVPLSRRKGTYHLLRHANNGFDATGKPTAAHIRNSALFQKRFPPSIDQPEASRQTCMKDEDGLSNINFSIVGRKTLPKPGTDERGLTIEMTTVSVSREAYP